MTQAIRKAQAWQTLAAKHGTIEQATLPPAPRSIWDVVKAVSPTNDQPVHFKQWIWYLHRAVRGGFRIVFNAPAQHWKTSTTLAALAWIILKHPGRAHVYMTYSVDRARYICRVFRTVLDTLGVPWDGTLDDMYLPGGTSIRFTSGDKGLNGVPCNGVFIVDDIYRSAEDADSKAVRELIETQWSGSVVPRLHPGASVLVLGTRYHPQDMYNKLLTQYGYKHVNLPAEAEADDPLGREVDAPLIPCKADCLPDCERHRPSHWLAKQKAEMLPAMWAAMMQGRPRMRGAGVFGPSVYFKQYPIFYRGAFGVDLAYTENKKSDFCANVEMWREETPDPLKPRYYITGLRHEKADAPKFAGVLVDDHERMPHFPMLWRCSGTEKGSAGFMRGGAYKLPLEDERPPGDKLVSARELAIAWNQGRVLLPCKVTFPEHAHWVTKLETEFADFTGSGKEHDDIVDAAGNAYHALTGGRNSILHAMAALEAREKMQAAGAL